MYLLNAESLALESFLDESKRPKYAILSHTWGEEEVLFHEISDLERARQMKGFAKIEYTCKQALADGLTHVWIDTVCIDKRSSAELSEAINSMFAWYEQSKVCYAFLDDVSGPAPGEPLLATIQRYERTIASLDPKEMSNVATELVSSRWFKRGWTLQELLAPTRIDFFGRSWTKIGRLQRHEDVNCEVPALLALISHATTIPILVLTKQVHLSDCAVARRMSWASRRETTRREDQAYCLLGVFGVNMPLLYGEGAKAFRRLQEAIAQVSSDHSLLLPSSLFLQNASSLFLENASSLSPWNLPRPRPERRRLLAERLGDFAGCAYVNRLGSQSYTLTKSGLEIQLRILKLAGSDWAFGILDCFDERYPLKPTALLLLRDLSSKDTFLLHRYEQPGVEFFLNMKCVIPYKTVLILETSDETRPFSMNLHFRENPHALLPHQMPWQNNQLPLKWSVRAIKCHPPTEWNLETLSCNLKNFMRPCRSRAIVVDVLCKTSETGDGALHRVVIILSGHNHELVSIRQYHGEDLDLLCNSADEVFVWNTEEVSIAGADYKRIDSAAFRVSSNLYAEVAYFKRQDREFLVVSFSNRGRMGREVMVFIKAILNDFFQNFRGDGRLMDRPRGSIARPGVIDLVRKFVEKGKKINNLNTDTGVGRSDWILATSKEAFADFGQRDFNDGYKRSFLRSLIRS